MTRTGVINWGAVGFFEHIVVRVLESALTDEIKGSNQSGVPPPCRGTSRTRV